MKKLSLVSVLAVAATFATIPLPAQILSPELLENLGSADLVKRYEAQLSLRKLAVEATAPGANPAAQAALEERLLALIADGSQPEPARVSMLTNLQFLGTERAVPVLGKLLVDPLPLVREGARTALKKNPSPAACGPLREALAGATEPAWVLGLMDALMHHRDKAAVPLLVGKLPSENPAIPALAAQALGTIGGKEAVTALVSFRNPAPSVLPVVQSAIVRAISEIDAEEKQSRFYDIGAKVRALFGKPDNASRIAALWPAAANSAVRCEIFGALTAMDPALTQKLLASAVADPAMPGAREILRMAVMSGHPELAEPVLAALPGLPFAVQQAIYGGLSDLGDTSREAEIRALAENPADDVRVAFVSMLGGSGTAASLPFLLEQASSKSPPVAAAAAEAIARLKLPELDGALLETARSGPDQIAAIRALSFRNPPGTEALLIELFPSGAPQEAQDAALEALEIVGQQEAALLFLRKIAAAPSPAGARPFQAAFRRLAPRLGATQVLWEQGFLPAWSAAASPENRLALLAMLPSLRSPQSGAFLVETVRTQRQESLEAIKLLTNWSSFDAADFLLDAAGIPGLDDATRAGLFAAATRLLFPNVAAPAPQKKAYADKLLAAAPEGPIRDAVQKAITDANL
jgi:HEAT repeat protein